MPHRRLLGGNEDPTYGLMQEVNWQAGLPHERTKPGGSIQCKRLSCNHFFQDESQLTKYCLCPSLCPKKSGPVFIHLHVVIDNQTPDRLPTAFFISFQQHFVIIVPVACSFTVNYRYLYTTKVCVVQSPASPIPAFIHPSNVPGPAMLMPERLWVLCRSD